MPSTLSPFCRLSLFHNSNLTAHRGRGKNRFSISGSKSPRANGACSTMLERGGGQHRSINFFLQYFVWLEALALEEKKHAPFQEVVNFIEEFLQCDFDFLAERERERERGREGGGDLSLRLTFKLFEAETKTRYRFSLCSSALLASTLACLGKSSSTRLVKQRIDIDTHGDKNVLFFDTSCCMK
jgi:hypothetical protein